MKSKIRVNMRPIMMYAVETRAETTSSGIEDFKTSMETSCKQDDKVTSKSEKK